MGQVSWGHLTSLFLLLCGWVPGLLSVFPHLSQGRPLYTHSSSGTQRGHSRQKPVSMSCQEQIAVFLPRA